MTSNRQRHKMSNRVWSTMRTLGNGFAQLSNDSLGGRYDVNRYGINIDVVTSDQVKTLTQRFYEHMKALGWVLEDNGSYSKLTSPDYSGYLALHAHKDSKRIHVSIQ